MRAHRSVLTGLCAALGMVLTMPTPTSARVVGIVFDDSGSMASRIHLPTFGVQLLVSTLDVRPGKDRLLTLRLSQLAGGVVEEPVGSTEALQRTVERIRQNWPKASGGTPYAPIERVLRAVVQTLRPDETGILFVLTDGQIDKPPAFAEMRQTFETLKRELDAKRASISVEFMLIAVGPERDKVRQAVRDQMVRAALLEQFNGNKREPDGSLVGDHEVTDVRDVFSHMKKIIARVSDTDVSRMGSYVGYSGNTVTVNTPLSVTRIVSVTNGVNAEPPVAQSRSFNPSRSFSIVSRMDAQDRALPNQLFRGSTEQMIFQPALDPGRHSVVYNGSAAENVFLIFETNARVELSVLDANGAEVRRDTSGAYVLAQNRDHRLVAVLVDETSQGRRIVPLSSLSGQTVFTATVDDPGGGRRVMPMQIVPAENRATAAFRPNQVGLFVARGQAQLEGFVSPLSDPVQLRVIEGTLTVESAVRPTEACTDCPEEMIRSTIGRDAASVEVATVEITPKGDSPGSAILDTSGLPQGVSLRDESGNPVADGTRLELVPARSIPLRIVRPGRPPADIVGKTVPLNIRLRGEQMMTGEHIVQRSLSIIAPQVRLIYTGHHGTTGDNGNLSVTGSELTDAKSKLEFRVENALDPVTLGSFKVASPSWLVDVDWSLAGEGLNVIPRARYWCMCFLWLDRGSHDVQVSYSGGVGWQNAHTVGRFEVNPTWSEIILGCLLLLGLLLLLAWFIGVIINVATARRFPRDSFLEIDEGQQLPRTVALRGRNWTFLRALLWPILGRPDERRVLEGLDLTAGGRLLLRVGRDSEDLNVRGEWLSDRFSINEKLDRLMLNLNWQEAVQKKGPPPVSIRSWKSSADRSREF
jgi:hypothetical protein